MTMPMKPGLDDFFPAPFAFEGTIFEMNRLVLVRLIATALLVVIFGIGASRAKLIPTKGQMILETFILFVRDQIAIETLGEKEGRRFAPTLTVIFLSVFFMNITGVIPGLNIAASSVVAVPLIFAIISYVVFIGAGIKRHGVVGYFRSQLFPSGVPTWLYVLLTPIELLSTFIIRPATLTVRLLSNMLAGHLMLALCFFGTHYLFFEAAGALKAVGVLTLAGGVVFTLFEIFVAGLQAYIFAILTSVYIKLSIEHH
ncbi:ATP synthase F0, A subunit [Gleimia coleocanis DSM 15436]|uniref:ATP synthase subunit a n=1 Tax=Gleimia coleocanis DSM 15436 TaxID=525245 RepID=C0VZZ9_9ACTO|nr:F0F1 ATP synthase subunit A [Gleimia coleocanis]EEH63858.1 ATP synthase F0, A subunit [Gleimia coleocanis DSM 15436]